MKNTKTRIGVLGCAKIARRSMLPAIKELSDDFDLIAVASRDSSKAIEFAKEFKCEAIFGYDQMIQREDIDAIYIPLPTGLHYEWIGKAISFGKHVYAEKSFASSAQQAKLLITSAEKKDVAIMEGFMFLYHRQQNIVASMIEGGELGELRHFYGYFGFPPLPETDFRYDEELGGGALMDAAGYPLRAAHFFCGDSLKVRAATLFSDAVSNSSLWGSAFLSNGMGLGASIAFGFDNSYQCKYEIWGSKAKVRLDRAYTPAPNFSPNLVLENSSGSRVLSIPPDNHFVGAMRRFRFLILNSHDRAENNQCILNQSQSLDDIKRIANLNFPIRVI